MTRDGQGCGAEQACDHGTRNTLFGALIKVDMQRSVLWCVVMDEMSNAPHYSSYRARLLLAISSVGKLFTLHSILLGSEREGDEGSRKELDSSSVHNVREVLSADLKLDVLQAEGMFRITGGVCVFPGAEKEVEGHPYAVNGGLISDRGRGELSSTKQDRQRDWFDSGRR